MSTPIDRCRLSWMATPERVHTLPDGFAWIHQVCPSAVLDLRYASVNNFVGRPLRGYHSPLGALTRRAALALSQVCADLRLLGMTLLVFDAYRPARSVLDMLEWTSAPVDPRTEAMYHPRVPKSELVARGYIADRSAHSRGSAVDVTLLALDDRACRFVEGTPLPNGEIDMGTPFDLFDPRSGWDDLSVPATCRANRCRLRELMSRHGFRHNRSEWWHFELRDEPFPHRWFDFPLRSPGGDAGRSSLAAWRRGQRSFGATGSLTLE